MIKKELQNDDRVVTLILIIGRNDESRKPVTPTAGLSPQGIEGEI